MKTPYFSHFHNKKSANIFNLSLSSFNFNFWAIISSIEFRSERSRAYNFRFAFDPSNFFFQYFDLDLGRAGEFSSDPSQISSNPMLGLYTESLFASIPSSEIPLTDCLTVDTQFLQFYRFCMKSDKHLQTIFVFWHSLREPEGAWSELKKH